MKRFEDYNSVKDLLSQDDIDRHKQGIMTTFEMDELTTREDILQKDYIVMQCIDCNKWSKMKHKPLKTELVDCSNCGGRKYDSTSLKSARTYDPTKDNKRRIKAIIKKKK
jgi:hypothetical protein